MKFLVAVDLEGCACVCGEPFKTLTESRDYSFACRQGAREAAAAARALISQGAEVIVWDNHGGSLNLYYDQLPEKCLILCGAGKRERIVPDIGCDGALLIGYHADGSVMDATLAHTYSSATYQYMKVNGVTLGEIGIDAMLLGERGIPVVMVSGDDKACGEAKRVMGNVITVQTKQSLGYNASISKHPAAVEVEIYEASVRAANSLSGGARPLEYKRPVTLEIRYKRIEAAGSAERSGFERMDAYTCRKEFDKLSDYFKG